MHKDVNTFLGNICNSRCIQRGRDGKFVCKKLNNMKESKENIKHAFKDLPNNLPQECIDKLIQCGFVVQEDTFDNGY